MTALNDPLKLIEKTRHHVRDELQHAEGGHDWFHTERVWRVARYISDHEGADSLIVSLGALLHDIADSKFYDGDEGIGPKRAESWLLSIEAPEHVTEKVTHIVRHISFKGGHHDPSTESLEFKVVQDADRLDALGAIGIARAFNYGGHRGRALYDPEIPPNPGMSKEEYKRAKGPTLNHFYEKLLLLKDKMNTETGRNLAEERHNYLLGYLDQFKKEWSFPK
jgi:uncharacterized protein